MDDRKVLFEELGTIGLTTDEFENLIKGYQKITIKKGDLLIKSGTVVKGYYFVISGFLRSFIIDFEGNEVTTNFYGKDALILEGHSFFMQIPTKEDIQAVEDCELWVKKLETFNKDFNLYKEYRDWGRSRLASDFFSLKERTLSMITDKASSRYKKLIKNNPEIIKKASLKHIASFLGITDTSLSRIRKEIS
ncbi:Crp/Fnr family transcriptional regulator [Polaribacter sargassicola]|uniref:Crp/Fnr family transcriptional regulator n=1 Tax=Polaribacter sargassicola TaxID=2836891 RepID=UPI001F1B6D1D|nr:Crp/Fnr family transcriptional regulator [Polaribacter sp. DS7-9]MCG1037179.1 Crp/Fnr family transcriptional regulator [Polaribacter sp. DS7-9]